MTNLRQIAQFLFRSQPSAIKPQEYAGELLKSRKLSIVDVCSLVLLKSVYKEPAISKIGYDDDSHAPALTTTGRSNALFEHMPTQIRLNQTGGHLRDRITQMPIGKRRFAKPATERFRLEDSTPGNYCITRCYSRQLHSPRRYRHRSAKKLF
jgi:hypothetical protein